jgi:hypothetical protein
MYDYSSPLTQLARLRTEHRRTREKRQADRLKTVMLLGSGWSAHQVAEALLSDPDTGRNHLPGRHPRTAEHGLSGRRLLAER